MDNKTINKTITESITKIANISPKTLKPILLNPKEKYIKKTTIITFD